MEKGTFFLRIFVVGRCFPFLCVPFFSGMGGQRLGGVERLASGDLSIVSVLMLNIIEPLILAISSSMPSQLVCLLRMPGYFCALGWLCVFTMISNFMSPG